MLLLFVFERWCQWFVSAQCWLNLAPYGYYHYTGNFGLPLTQITFASSWISLEKSGLAKICRQWVLSLNPPPLAPIPWKTPGRFLAT